MSKFARLHQYLVKSGIAKSNIIRPKQASVDDLTIAHAQQYLQGLCDNGLDEKAWRRIGLPWSQGLITRTLTAPNGTLLTARVALKTGLACHLAGGTHHAHYDFGSGFCMVNDLAYTAKTLLAEKAVERILIFDLDVHQGDGTASILANEPNAFTCSIHCEKNFPFRKSASDLDVGLAIGLDDQAYLSVVRDTFEQLIAEQKPDLVLYDAGVDVWQNDALGRLDISWQGIYQRDHYVIDACLARGIPVATVIGGGYDKNHQRLAERHAIVVEAANDCYRSRS
ncbi:histone deacetylase family protein [Thalassotalea euphylliae]|uniref:Histone deacetylase n=1 Tax=Thalassotalea euphylliae TaxID=1655234 RepID=A0A3E0U5H6_9GAMM|nr:histone deacetylase [Thalassotalea euphylliae]REL32251.1 histone deacetylase [Thalassotalea euphylliae]